MAFTMQVDAYQAARNPTRAYSVLAMFLFVLMAFQFFMGESLGLVRTRQDAPRQFWTVLGVQAAAFVFLIVLLVLRTR